MTQQQEWTIVTILFWTGIACLVVGYFPDLKIRFQTGKIFGWEFLKQALIAIVMASAVYWVTIVVTIQIKQWAIISAHLFEPEPWARKNRAFVTETPDQIMAYFKTYTNITAYKMLGKYTGKWYAISGQVGDVQDFESALGKKLAFKNQISVSLELKGNFPLRSLSFEDRWTPEIELLNRGDQISAYCKIGTINSFSISLEQCQIVRR
jgi:hypothetical protein